MSHKVSVIFVCLGNICRSPTAHAVFRDLVLAEDLQDQIRIDSAGTASCIKVSRPTVGRLKWRTGAVFKWMTCGPSGRHGGFN